MTKKEVITLVVILIVLLLAIPTSALPNPAATYCKDLGYDYYKVRLEDGTETGYCNADGTECEEWEFYKGQCAPEKSICGINGYDTITTSDGEDMYSQEYAVCVEKQVSPLTGLATYTEEKTGALGRFIRWLGNYMITGRAVTDTNHTGDSVAGNITDDIAVNTTANTTGNITGNITDDITVNTTAQTTSNTTSPDAKNTSGNSTGATSEGNTEKEDEAQKPVRILASNLAGLHRTVEEQTLTMEPDEDAPPKISPDMIEEGDAAVQGDRASTAAPSSFDWRDYNGENWITPIRNQGGCGSCWAFGAVATAEAKMKIERGDPNFNPDLSEQELVSCSSAGDCGGGYHDNALNYIKNNGVADEGCREYTASNSACGSCLAESKRKWYIDGTHKYTDSSTSTAKQHLVDHGPLAVNYYHYGSFDGNGVYRCSSECSPFSDYFYNHWSHGHCVSLVGYNDAGGYWIAKNSWGPYYQDNGYFKIGYGECEILYGCPLDYSRNHVYVDKEWPDTSKTVDISNVNVYDGSYTGSISYMQDLDGTYLTYYDHGSGGDYDGLSAYQYMPESEFQNPQRMTLYANVRGRDADDFELYRSYSTLEYLGYVPQSSSTFYLMKYELCDTESECESLFYSNYLRFIYAHPSCTSCSADYLDVDWFVVETLLDTDDDGVTDDDDECPTTYGTYCHGCPQPTCAPCSYNPTCPTTGQPYCSAKYGTSTLCDSTWKCSSGTGNNRYGTGGEYNCRGYCDGYGNCDYAGGCYYSTSCDTDDDDDGVLDINDDCPGTPSGELVDINGCTHADVDQDFDGTCDPGDSSPLWCTGTDQCQSTYGTYCNGCPDITCDVCISTKVCPPGGKPYCTGYHGTDHMCDATYRCSSGEGDGNYNTPGEYSCRGYCDGSGNCDHAKDCQYSADCDTDDDNDGVADVDDDCAGTPEGESVDVNGCSQSQVDSDSDGVCNIGDSSPLWCSGVDWCGSTPPGATVDSSGCSQSQVDSDSDGVCNEDYIFSTSWCDGEDQCPNTPKKYDVDSNGCAQVQVDYDLDGLCNPGMSSPGWCTGTDGCPSRAGPSCNDGCPDEEAPPTLLKNPSNTTYSSHSIPVKVSVDTSAENCLDSVWLMNGTQMIPVTSTYSGIIHFPKGNTTLILYANDTTGNTNSSTAGFRVAFVPNITMASPENKTYQDGTITVNVTVNETAESINLSTDHAAPVTLCHECDAVQTDIAIGDGWHDLAAYVTDKAGDVFNRTARFLVDSTPPEIHSYNLEHNQTIEGNSTTTFIVNYTEQNLENVTFFLNITQQPVTGCTPGMDQTCQVTKDLSCIGHGAHLYFSFRINDTAGSTDTLFAPDDSGPYLLRIDRQEPVITVLSPLNNSVQGYFFYLNITLDEEADIKYSLDEGANTTSCTSCTSYTKGFSGLSEAKHNFTIWAEDGVGHESSIFINFSVDLDELEVDDDDDGVNNANDLCPETEPGATVDSNGCTQEDVDTDADGVCDTGKSSPTWCTGSDACPDTPSGDAVDSNGCTHEDVDQDLDGTCDPGSSSPTWCTGSDACPTEYGTDCNGCDNPVENDCTHTLVCPASGPPYYSGYYTETHRCNEQFKCSGSGGAGAYNTPGEMSCQGYCDGAGECDFAGNCSYSASCDTDDDDDGVLDVNDLCAGTASGSAVDTIGCNQTQVDSDRDGLCDTGKWSPDWCNYTDWCPGSIAGDPVDDNGCTRAQVDPDDDGVCTLGESSPTWCIGSDDCTNDAGPACNRGCPDSTPPSLYMISPTDKTYPYSSISVHIVSSDSCMHRTVFHNGTANTSLEPGIPVYRSYPDGEYTITAYANDTTGNTNSTSVSFVVDTAFPGLTIPSPAESSEVGYWFWFNTTTDENTTILYSLDGAENITLCTDCNETAKNMSGLDTGQHKLVVTAYDRARNTNASAVHFDVAPDFDMDGTHDLLDEDDDNDGIGDATDRLLGNSSNIDTTIPGIRLWVNDSEEVDREFDDDYDVNVTDQTGNPIIEFRWNFSHDTLTVNWTVNATNGTTRFGGLDLAAQGRTKTLYVNKSDSDDNYVCIADDEVTTTLPADCTGYTKVSCGSTGRCTDLGDRFKVTGLSHSIIRSVYIEPSDPPSGGGGGGGGSYTSRAIDILPSEEGVVVEMGKNDDAVLYLGVEEYPLTVTSVGIADIMFTLNRYYYTIGSYGQKLDIDADKDATRDITAELLGISGGEAKLKFSLYSPPQRDYELLPPAPPSRKKAVAEEPMAEEVGEEMQAAAAAPEQSLEQEAAAAEEQAPPPVEESTFPGMTSIIISIASVVIAVIVVLVLIIHHRRATGTEEKPAYPHVPPAPQKKPVKQETAARTRQAAVPAPQKPAPKPKQEQPRVPPKPAAKAPPRKEKTVHDLNQEIKNIKEKIRKTKL